MKQHRPKTRARHGSPQFSKRIAAWVTPAQRRAFERGGGSEWLRKVLDFYLGWNRQASKAKKGRP